MRTKVLMGLATLAMVAFLSSCGKVPQAEIDAVNAAIEAAKTAEAAVYVPNELAAVQDSVNAVMADIEAQKSKLFKKFGPAKEKLQAALTLANQVAANAATKKEEVKAQVTTLMTDIKTVVEENKTLITKAPKGKEGRAVLEQINAEMTTIENSITEAQGLFDNGSFMDAFNKINAAMESAKNINTELKEAIAKVSR